MALYLEYADLGEHMVSIPKRETGRAKSSEDTPHPLGERLNRLTLQYDEDRSRVKADSRGENKSPNLITERQEPLYKRRLPEETLPIRQS